jgi:hypothetical protein
MTSTNGGEAPPPPPLTPAERAAAIGSRLRQIFDDAAAEPMPDAFEELLRKLG